MFTYRCIPYLIQWQDGIARFTIHFPRLKYVEGEGNHGTVKGIIDRWLDAHGYTNQ